LLHGLATVGGKEVDLLHGGFLRPDGNFHFQCVFTAAYGDAFDWCDVPKIATPCNGEVSGCGDDVEISLEGMTWLRYLPVKASDKS